MMQVRPATLDDSRRIFEWRNDPVTVATSRSRAGVEWSGHETWFSRQLSQTDTACLIGLHQGEPCGVTWFRKNRTGLWETSVNLAPAFRGMKLSTPMLACAMRWMESNFSARCFSTEVAEDNPASIRMFEKCGFRYVHSSGDFGVYCTCLSVP